MAATLHRSVNKAASPVFLSSLSFLAISPMLDKNVLRYSTQAALLQWTCTISRLFGVDLNCRVSAPFAETASTLVTTKSLSQKNLIP
jgi:hypothetical protein